MKIRAIKATPVNIPFVAPYRFSYGSAASVTKTVVELETEDGITGLGEVADGDRAAQVNQLGERLIGLDLREITLAERRCLPGMRFSIWGDIAGLTRAFGGIEMAMWDARARTEGVALSTLIGGRVRAQIAVTEYFSYRLVGEGTGGESSPLEVARYCGHMAEQFNADTFEGKVGTVTLAEEVEMVREVRAAIGPNRRLQLDANGAWTVPTARDAFRQMDPYWIHYYEEPVETYEEMAQIRAHTLASFSSHTVDLEKAVRLRAPDTIVTNLAELGGIRRTLAFIRACEIFDIGFRFHSGETGVATAAYLQVSAAVEHIREPSQTLLRWYGDDVVAEGTPQPKDGLLPVPEGPGLGVTLDPKALARCHERYLSEGAFPQGQVSPGQRDQFFRV